MRRTLLSMAAVLMTICAVAQSEEDLKKVQIKTTKVAGSVYMLEGAGGNIAASVGDDGIIIVDDQFAPLADKIKAALKEFTDKPVRFVINTHYHGDHTGANAPFATGGSTVIAQDNVRKRMESGGTGGVSDAMNFPYKASDKNGLPIVTFNDKATVWLNGEEIRAIHFPAGHTDGDAVIWFVKSNVVHMGDDFVTYGYPFVDVMSGGSVSGIISGCEKVLATVPKDTKFIPGHGPLSTGDDLRAYVAMMKETRAVVAAEVKKGRTLQQIQKAKVLAKWDEKYGKDYIKPEVWIETLYRDIQNSKGGAKYVNHGHANE